MAFFSPLMQSALVDPLPEVRATAAKALGSLVKGVPLVVAGCCRVVARLLPVALAPGLG